MTTISMRFSRALLLIGASFAAGAGCELLTAVDRTGIPADGGAGQGGANQGGGGSHQGGGGASQGGGGANQGGGGGGAACDDGVKNGSETDVDCGGVCPGCATGLDCGGDADCASGKCGAGVCVDALLISEVRSRGPGGSGDEFVELFNPTGVAVTTDATWRIVARAAPGVGPCENNAEESVWTGAGETIPPHAHLLIGGAAYAGATAADAASTAPIDDGASVRIEHGAAVVDAVCVSAFSVPGSLNDLTTCSIPYTCEGTPVTNLHDNTNGTNSNVSLERKPGGMSGNATDTGDSSADFKGTSPSFPQNLASPATP